MGSETSFDALVALAGDVGECVECTDAENNSNGAKHVGHLVTPVDNIVDRLVQHSAAEIKTQIEDGYGDHPLPVALVEVHRADVEVGDEGQED